MMTASDLAVLEGLQQETLTTLHDVLGGSAAAHQPVALLDFPDHQNVGDALIWAGERAYLDRLGRRVDYACTMRTLDPAELRRRVPEGPVLLQGGGNFGDLYPGFQIFRERVVAEFTDRTIIQLPQSVWFASQERAAAANAALGAHPDFTLLIREADSLERCRVQLPDVRTVFCHDAAVGVGPLRRRPPRQEVLALLRRDQESAGSLEQTASAVDWGLTGAHRYAYAGVHVPGRLARKAGVSAQAVAQPLLAASYEAVARINVDHGARLLSRGRKVLTDRLHAHVMSALLGIPHVVVDNTYGKVGAVMAASTGRFSTVHLVQDPQRVPEVLASV